MATEIQCVEAARDHILKIVELAGIRERVHVVTFDNDPEYGTKAFLEVDFAGISCLTITVEGYGAYIHILNYETDSDTELSINNVLAPLNALRIYELLAPFGRASRTPQVSHALARFHLGVPWEPELEAKAEELLEQLKSAEEMTPEQIQEWALRLAEDVSDLGD